MSRKFADAMNSFLQKNALWICLGVVLLILIAILVLLLNNKSKKNKTPINQGNDWIKALGDISNINDVNGAGSRLSVTLINKELVNRDELTRLGAQSVVSMSNKITIVIEDKAEKIASDMKQLLNK